MSWWDAIKEEFNWSTNISQKIAEEEAAKAEMSGGLSEATKDAIERIFTQDGELTDSQRREVREKMHKTRDKRVKGFLHNLLRGDD